MIYLVIFIVIVHFIMFLNYELYVKFCKYLKLLQKKTDDSNKLANSMFSSLEIIIILLFFFEIFIETSFLVYASVVLWLWPAQLILLFYFINVGFWHGSSPQNDTRYYFSEVVSIFLFAILGRMLI